MLIANKDQKENEVYYRLCKKRIILQCDQRLRNVLSERENKSDIKTQTWKPALIKGQMRRLQRPETAENKMEAGEKYRR